MQPLCMHMQYKCNPYTVQCTGLSDAETFQLILALLLAWSTLPNSRANLPPPLDSRHPFFCLRRMCCSGMMPRESRAARNLDALAVVRSWLPHRLAALFIPANLICNASRMIPREHVKISSRCLCRYGRTAVHVDDPRPSSEF